MLSTPRQHICNCQLAAVAQLPCNVSACAADSHCSAPRGPHVSHRLTMHTAIEQPAPPASCHAASQPFSSTPTGALGAAIFKCLHSTLLPAAAPVLQESSAHHMSPPVQPSLQLLPPLAGATPASRALPCADPCHPHSASDCCSTASCGQLLGISACYGRSRCLLHLAHTGWATRLLQLLSVAPHHQLPCLNSWTSRQ